MKKQLIITMLFIFVAVVAFIVLEQIQYGLGQEYAKIAPEQVLDNTDSYRILKSQDNISNLINYVEIFVFLLAGIFTFDLWNKYFKREKEKKEE